jgi:hypothetical protein
MIYEFSLEIVKREFFLLGQQGDSGDKVVEGGV